MTVASEQTTPDPPTEKIDIGPTKDQSPHGMTGFPQVMPLHRPRPQIHWRFIIWSVMITLAVIMLVTYGQAIFFATPEQQIAEERPRFVVPLSPAFSATPSTTPTATPAIEVQALTFLEPTVTLTPVPGGRLLILTPAARDTGWVVNDDESIITSYDPQNHFGDSFLYAGMLDGKIYKAALQFDLRRIPRGTKIYAASLRLTGLRAGQLSKTREGTWQLQILDSKVDNRWRDHNYDQLQAAPIWSTFEPALTTETLGEGVINEFIFTSEQLALLERRIVEGSDQFGRKISFRLDGPTTGDDNLFAWDTGYGPASKRAIPELFLSLGRLPKETPPPYYVVITSTPTPEDIMTAVAISLRMTVEAEHVGTATPLPPHWVTPFVVTVTPTAENQATAQAMAEMATAVSLTTGEPPNMATATPTPTYVVITVTPTPENVMTAAAEALRVATEIKRVGTPTPFPANWATPAVVTSTPTPENMATAEYLIGLMLLTGTPTTTPGNVQTATPTPIFIIAEFLASPTATATPTGTPQPIPAELLGKIVFLSDREGATEAERIRADKQQATPRITPQPYLYDPASGQVARLTDRWPYDVVVTRDAWSADATYETYTQQLLWTNVNGRATKVFALHYYDHTYEVETQITYFGTGIAWDPAWSPVRDQITFVSNVSGDDEIWVINRDSSNALQLTASNEAYNAREIGKDTFIPEVNGHPSWSPDGGQIVFWSNRTGNRQIWFMNADGSDQRLLMGWDNWNPYNDWDPVWIKYPDPAPALERRLDWRFIKPPEDLPK